MSISAISNTLTNTAKTATKSNKLEELIAKGMIAAGNNTLYNGAAKALMTDTYTTKVADKMQTASSLFLSGFYMLSTLTNKNIPAERKPTMVVSDVITAAFSTLAGEGIRKVFNKGFEKYADTLRAKAPELISDKNFQRGVSTAASLTAVTLAFRYLGPVIATPLAKKICGGLQKVGILKTPETKKA